MLDESKTIIVITESFDSFMFYLNVPNISDEWTNSECKPKHFFNTLITFLFVFTLYLLRQILNDDSRLCLLGLPTGVVAVGTALVGVAGGSCTAALAAAWTPACPDLGGSRWWRHLWSLVGWLLVAHVGRGGYACSVLLCVTLCMYWSYYRFIM